MPTPTLHDTPLIGLFATQKRAEGALSALNALDLKAGAIQVVESPHLDSAARTAVPAVAAPGPVGWPGPVPLPLATPDRPDFLARLGVPSADADFYASAIDRGATLIVVDVDPDQASRVRQLLGEHGAMNLKNEAG